MSDSMTTQQPGLLSRLWTYQAERFPLGKTSVLLAAFSSASINASALMAGRPLPGWGTYAVGFLLAMILMFHLRVLDEIKDEETDRLHRPERPIPRGLVSLTLVKQLGLGTMLAALLLAAMIHPGLPLVLIGVWAFMGLMTAHFFVPKLLHRSPLLTLLSHMLVMPLIDLLVTACEWLPHGVKPPGPLWIFLALSFMNGCVIEIGRKLWATRNERPGVETYSGTWGPMVATMAWFVFASAAAALLMLLANELASPWTTFAAALGMAGVIWAGLRYLDRKDPASQKLADAMAGVWVLLAYLAAGYLPLLTQT